MARGAGYSKRTTLFINYNIVIVMLRTCMRILYALLAIGHIEILVSRNNMKNCDVGAFHICCTLPNKFFFPEYNHVCILNQRPYFLILRNNLLIFEK